VALKFFYEEQEAQSRAKLHPYPPSLPRLTCIRNACSSSSKGEGKHCCTRMLGFNRKITNKEKREQTAATRAPSGRVLLRDLQIDFSLRGSCFL